MNPKVLRAAFSVIIIAALGIAGISPTQQVRADGLLMIEGVYRQPLYSHVDVSIENKIATTVLEQKFYNELEREVSAVYVAPVPDGATILSFAEKVDDKWVEAEIQEKEDAEAAYATAVSEGKDAALAGAMTATPAPNQPATPKMNFQIKVFLPPSSERTIRLIYTEVLLGEVGLTRYTYPLSNTNLTEEPIGDLYIKVQISEKDEIRAVYTPTHKNSAEVSRPQPNTASLVYRAQNVVPNQDFEVIYTQSPDKFGVNLASYVEGEAEDGYFVLIAAPQLETKTDEEVIPKDFVFILDKSGSMQGDKIVQAKNALNMILGNLNPQDRFNIVAFSSLVETYAPQLLPVEKRGEAQAWVNNVFADGGTNINDALVTALKTVDSSQPERPHIIVFLTDGQATEGVTETTAILDNVRAARSAQSRIYSIGVGDVNEALLNAVSSENRGTSLFVSATQPLEQPLADFYAAIDSPVLVDLALDFGEVEVYDVQPNPIPDMFLGGQVVITGRYRRNSPDKTTITLTGAIGGEPYSAIYKDISFNTDSTAAKPYAFVPRLWAQRKVDNLMLKINIEGPDPKLVDEVRELALKYNLITPYTSFVAVPGMGNPGMIEPDSVIYHLSANRHYRNLNTLFIVMGLALIFVGSVGLVINRIAHRRDRASKKGSLDAQAKN